MNWDLWGEKHIWFVMLKSATVIRSRFCTLYRLQVFCYGLKVKNAQGFLCWLLSLM